MVPKDNDEEQKSAPQQLLDRPDLATALESERFKQFLDHVPFGVAVSTLHPSERVSYANIEFENLTGLKAAEVAGGTWDLLPGRALRGDWRLSEAVSKEEDHVGVFSIENANGVVTVDAWSSLIEDDDGKKMFRLVALAKLSDIDRPDDAVLEVQLREKDTMLRELQHRVKNNLQMITALIRLEARNLTDGTASAGFDRLASRINALALLYRSLSEADPGETVDLGVYLSEVASAVMKAHAVEGIRLDMKVDAWPVSVNVAMPTGLVVNEVLTNALKYAFEGRKGGTITLRSLVDETGCRVTIADNGNGLAEGAVWPKPGRLSAMIVQSLRENAKARVEMESEPGKGTRVTIFFARADANPPES